MARKLFTRGMDVGVEKGALYVYRKRQKGASYVVHIVSSMDEKPNRSQDVIDFLAGAVRDAIAADKPKPRKKKAVKKRRKR